MQTMITVSTTQHPLYNPSFPLLRPKLRTTQHNPRTTRSGPRLCSVKPGPPKGRRSHKVELDFDEDYYDDEDDDEDGEVFVAFPKMKEWLEKKPSGFGEGKVYDTAIEDRLFEEIERSKMGRGGDGKVKEIGLVKGDKAKPKALEAVPSGIPVRLLNLPKKKNVNRDLKSAFEGVPGIISISPAVSGNKKTRDPICKGFGFVYFKTEEHALRFVQIFSRQSITFGKVEKQIKCEMVESRSSNSLHQQQRDVFAVSQIMDSRSDEILPYDTDINEYSMGSRKETTDESDEGHDEDLTSELEDIDKNSEYLSKLENIGKDMEPQSDSEKNSIPSVQKTKTKRDKKPVTKQKKLQKSVIPGSAKRLKVKEKSVLTGVLSKYGAKPAAEG